MFVIFHCERIVRFRQFVLPFLRHKLHLLFLILRNSIILFCIFVLISTQGNDQHYFVLNKIIISYLDVFQERIEIFNSG